MIHWSFLKPVGPKRLWRGLTIQPTIVKSDPHLKAIDNSVALVIVPFIILILPVIVAGLFTVEKSDFRMSGFRAPDIYDLMLAAWGAAHMYWVFSIISKGIVLYRSTLITLSKDLVDSGINPNETKSGKK